MTAAESELTPRQRQRYLAGLTGRARARRAAEIVDRRADRSNAPFATDTGRRTRRSQYAVQFARQYGRAPRDVADAADLTGIPEAVLRQVYARGMAAWQTGHRPGASQHAWAMARVQSFAVGGRTASTADADLARQVRNPASTAPAASSGDQRHASDGYGFLVLDRRGVRVAYCDRIHDAAAEANRIRGTAWQIAGSSLRRVGAR